MMVPLLINLARWALVRAEVLPPSTPNPVSKLLWLSGKLPDGRYTKHRDDFIFVLWHVVFWSL
jgi:hypothetical protein